MQSVDPDINICVPLLCLIWLSFPRESGNEVPCIHIIYTFLLADGVDLVWKDGVLGLKDQ